MPEATLLNANAPPCLPVDAPTRSIETLAKTAAGSDAEAARLFPLNTPVFAFWAFLLAHVSAWTLAPFLSCPNAPLDLVEMVYWGREWQWGYPKHPPLVGWLAAAIVSATGASTWGLFLAAQLAIAVALWCVWRLGREIAGPRVALLGVAAMEGCVFLNFDGVVFNNNVGLYPFWALGALGFYFAFTRVSLRYWIATGLAIGMGLLCKYSMIVLPVAAFGLMTLHPKTRPLWLRSGPYVLVSVAALVTAPHICWAIQNGFPGFSYALERVEGSEFQLGRLLAPLEFAVSQVFVLSLVALVAWPALGWRWRLRTIATCERFDRDFLLAITLGPFAILLVLSLALNTRFHPLHGSHLWPFAGLTLLYFFRSRSDRKTAARSMAWSATVGIALLVAFVARISAVPFLNGHPAREHFPGARLAAEVGKLWEQRVGGQLPTIAGDAWLAGNVAFYSPASPRYFSGVKCPWMGRAEVLRHGAVIVWDAGERSLNGMPEWCGQWPTAEFCAPLSLKYQTAAELPGVVIGVAIIPPGEANEHLADQRTGASTRPQKASRALRLDSKHDRS